MPEGAQRPRPRALDVRAVLFDLDGTVADSAPDLAGALNRVRRDRGLPPIAPAVLRPHASSGARGLLGAGMGIDPGHAEYPRLREQFLAYYESGLADETTLFAGFPRLLDTLRARGFRCGIVTNKFARFADRVVSALGLASRIDVLVSGDTTPHSKPHPGSLLHAAATVAVAPEQCVYVGDDLRDVLAGNAARMATLVAQYGYLGESGSSEGWPATGWIDQPDDLMLWLPARAA